MKSRVFSRSVIAWAFFDFANSSYTTVIITALYSRYFINVVGVSFGSFEASRLWFNALALSYLIVSILSPVLGVLLDISSRKKLYLFSTYFLCVLSTFLLFFTEEGDIYFALSLVILSNIGFSLGENIISSFLPSITSLSSIGKVSGFGWGFGYFGGIISLLACLILLSFWEGSYGLRLSFLFVSLFFGVSAIPTFLWLKEKDISHIGAKDQEELVPNILSLGWSRLLSTLREIRRYSELFKLLLSYFTYYAALMTVITYSSLYAQNVFHFGNIEVIFLIILVNIFSAVGSFVFGFIQDSMGAKRTLLFVLILWILMLICILYTEDRVLFWFMASIIGIGIGAIQSTTRAIVGIFSPASRSGEFYGLWGFSGKLSAILGLYFFGFILELFKSSKYALVFSICLFVLSLLIVFLVNESKGVRQARE